MAEAIIYPGLFTIVAALEAIFGFFILLANRKAAANRAMFWLMVLFSLHNVAMIGMLSGINPRGALFYHWLLVCTTFIIGPAVLLTSFYLLRSSMGRMRIAAWGLAALIAGGILIFSLDALGVTQVLTGGPLFFNRLSPSEFLSGYRDASELTTGFMRPVLLFSLVGLPLIAMIYPSLSTGIGERKSNPENSNFGYILFTALLISTLLAGLREIIGPITASLGQNLVLAIGFAYVGLLRGSDQFSIRQLPQAFADWPMFNKLQLVVGAIALPSILISGLLAINFFQNLMVRTIGEDLNLLANAELRNVTDELNRQVDNLLVLAEDTLVVTSAVFRESTYFNLSEDEIQGRIAENEEDWVSSEDDSSFVTSHLSAARSSTLQQFSDITPAHHELVLSDLYGALYTATARTNHYDFSDTEWWQGAYNNGKGAIYIGSPTFDAEIGQYLIEIAVPVYSPARESEVFGVLLSRYNLEGVNRELQSVTLGETGGLSLFSAEGDWLPTDAAMVQSDPGLNWDLLRTNEVPWAVTPYGGVDSIISWAEIGENEMESYLSLQVVAQMPTDEALAGIVFVRNLGYLVFLVVAAAAYGITFVLANFITLPLSRLTDAARKVLEGETGVQAEVMGRDEIGTLASTFNSMTSQLTQLVLGLEETVGERTMDLERRALQLETAAEVARESAAIRDVNDLLERATHLITERFGYYHTGIFLLDENKKFAVLQAANSPGGMRMLARGHKLEVGKVGVVGYAAGQAEPRIAQDVGADVIYYDNPDMPQTRSEMALPLMIHGEVIGVLDVQSERSNAFGKEDVQVLQTLADQIALAIENARLFERSQSALSELENLYGREIGQAWERQKEDKPLAFTYTPAGTVPGAEEDPSGDTPFQKISREISYRGHTLGTIDLIREEGDKPFSADELAMVDDVIEQTALALENARLSDQIRLRSDQIQLLQEVTALAASTLDENQLLMRSAERIRTGMKVERCAIAILVPGKEAAEWKAASQSEGLSRTPTLGSQFRLNNEVTLEVIRSKKSAVFYDLANDVRYGTMLEITGAEDTATAVIVPMIVREQFIGMICLMDGNERRKIDAEELNLLGQISTQVSSAIDVARLFVAEKESREEAARRAEREHLVASITTKVRASNNPETIIKTAIEELRQAIGPGRQLHGSATQAAAATATKEKNGQEVENRPNS